MSEEKKNLTDEERKGLKEELKKKIDEMSDDELECIFHINRSSFTVK